MLAVGFRGDVQPVVALGGALAAAGHDVRVATSPEFEGLVTEAGLSFSPAGPRASDVINAEDGRTLVGGDRGIVRQAAQLRRVLDPLVPQLLQDLRRAVEGADAVLFTPLVNIGDIPDLGVPAIMVSLWPKSRTSAFPAVGFPHAPLLDGPYNRLTHVLLEQLSWRPLQRQGNRVRQALGMPPLRWDTPLGHAHKRRLPVLYGFSEAVVPRPPDWGPWLHITGYWFHGADPGWQPRADLRRFLDQGDPPVVVTFGSMTRGDPSRLTRIAAQALRLAGRRGVLVGPLDPVVHSDRLFHVSEIPHHWLFPKAAAVVHHGGAGTAAAALRAGVPNITVPYFADQPFWAERIRALPAGPDPLPRRTLTPERLAAAINHATSDQRILDGARRISRRLRQEDGLTRAVQTIERHLESHPKPPTEAPRPLA